MDVKEEVYSRLKELGIEYEVDEHEAAFTIEEVDKLGIFNKGVGCKNLFLRDGSGKRHFLVVAPEHKEVDLKKVREQIGSSRLSFGSAERLERCLGLTQGSVSPFGVINDKECKVEIVFDEDLKGVQKAGFHPNINTATVWLKFSDLVRFIENNGNNIMYVKL
ncbi:MAG: prolyl-tRNA synthetase associated domain-containing protein [Clostridia bacterium]|nr:prolyl-tRNA synthetase associated domain-containing protein [Clostridia bacterium]